MQTVDIFDAKLQKVVPHTITVDGNGEFLFESESGRFFKLPADTNPADFQKYFEEHKTQNEGQISLEEQEAKLEAFFKLSKTPPAEETIEDIEPVEDTEE